jgi:hypothetical protein
MLCQHAEIPHIMEVVDVDAADEAELPLLEGLKELPFDKMNVGYYMGGVGNGLGLRESTFFFSF